MSKLEKIASKYKISDDAIKSVSGEYTLAPSLYANQIDRKYPMHTKEACELSMAEYLYDQNGTADKESGVYKTLDKAASLYGLAWPVANETILTKVSAATDDGEILEVEFANTPEGVQKAMDAVLQFRKTAAYVPCQTLAKGVVKEAFKHDCDIPDAIMKLAGYAVGTKEAALNAISKRANRIGNSDTDKRMQQMMDQINATPGDVIPSEDLTKIAEVLDAFDGLREDRGYTTYNTPPEQELFNKSAFDLVTALEDELLIPSVNTVVSKKDLTKNASVIMPILNDMGISCEEKDIATAVSGLNEKQANYLFGELDD